MAVTILTPTILRPSRKRLAIPFLICLVLVLLSIWMVRAGNPLGYLSGTLFAVGLLVCALCFHPKAAYLHLAEDRFTFCSFFRTYTVSWLHVREFAVISIGPNQKVAWNLVSGYDAPGRIRTFSKSLYGYEAALPETYGMKAKELVELMERLRWRFVCPPNAYTKT